jgi:hypothetical protein
MRLCMPPVQIPPALSYGPKKQLQRNSIHEQVNSFTASRVKHIVTMLLMGVPPHDSTD